MSDASISLELSSLIEAVRSLGINGGAKTAWSAGPCSTSTSQPEGNVTTTDPSTNTVPPPPGLLLLYQHPVNSSGQKTTSITCRVRTSGMRS